VPALIVLNAARFIEDNKGHMWLPISEILNRGLSNTREIELVQVDEDFYEVLGYSFMRRAYWVKPIQIEGCADHLEDELDELL
jgi:hypothetical protein